MEQHVVKFKAALFVEDGVWISHVPLLEISTFGYSVEEAIEKTQELVAVFLADCAKRGVLEQVLLSSGFSPYEISPLQRAIEQKPGLAPPIDFTHQAPERQLRA